MSITLKVVAVAVGIAVFAGVSASAATLGGIKTDDLGANSNAVAPQLTNGVAVSYVTSYNASVGYYTVSSVSLVPVNTTTDKFPTGAAIRLTLKGATGTSLVELTGTGVGTTAPIVLSVGSTVAASDVAGASLVVNGGAVTALVSTNK